jgi:hypothetical protein
LSLDEGAKGVTRVADSRPSAPHCRDRPEADSRSSSADVPALCSRKKRSISVDASGPTGSVYDPAALPPNQACLPPWTIHCSICVLLSPSRYRVRETLLPPAPDWVVIGPVSLSPCAVPARSRLATSLSAFTGATMVSLSP